MRSEGMVEVNGMGDAPFPRAGAGAEEWMALSDALLGGLVHALNNRVTALSVCAELAGLGDVQMVVDGMLPAETTRLQRASALIGLLPARERPAEALELAPVLDDAISLHAHHPRMRSIECTVDTAAPLQPVRAPRWALLRLLLIVVDAAKTTAEAARLERIVVHLSGDDEVVRARAGARSDGGVYGARMATLCGGVLQREGEQLVLTLPSLLSVRERERTARAAE